MSVATFLETKPKGYIVALSAIMTIALLILSWSAGVSLFILPLYLLPLFVLAWYAGRTESIVCAVLISLFLFAHEVTANSLGLEPVLPYWNALSKLALFLIFIFGITELKSTKINAKELVKTDVLTGVFNRKAFYDLAGIEISRSRRYKRPFTVAYIDIDNLKIVNYNLGHSIGDSLLFTVAQCAKKNLREVDVVSRFGGDEFAILLPETASEQAQIVFSRLRNNLLDVMKRNDWPVTFSFGVVTFMSAPISVEEMIKKATVLMYSAKNSGTNMIDQEVYVRE